MKLATPIKHFLSLVLLVGATCALAQAEPANKSKTPVLTRAQFEALLQKPEKLVIVDVRRPDEVTAIGGFPVYLSIQLADLEKSLAWIPRDRKVVAASNHAGRAAKAADLLAAHGFKVVGAIGAQTFEQEGGKIAHIAPPAPPAAPGPSLALAARAAQVALDACTAKGFNVGVSVIDSAGSQKAFLAKDGTSPRGVQSSTNKALTALAFKDSTSRLGERAKSEATLASAVAANPSFNVRAGGVLLKVNDQVLGAIGVGGARGSENDEACAIAGVEAIQKELTVAGGGAGS
jgi:uncharacterized protein GlcG (DUF336 family)/rhodanese-related sulfurtransferase